MRPLFDHEVLVFLLAVLAGLAGGVALATIVARRLWPAVVLIGLATLAGIAGAGELAPAPVEAQAQAVLQRPSTARVARPAGRPEPSPAAAAARPQPRVRAQPRPAPPPPPAAAPAIEPQPAPAPAPRRAAAIAPPHPPAPLPLPAKPRPVLLAEAPASPPPPPPEPGPESPPTDPPPPPPGPLEIADVRLEWLSQSAVRVLWRTSLPAWTQGARALGDEPAVWGDMLVPGVEHETVFSGLGFSSSYRLWLAALDGWQRVTTTALDVTTAPPGEQVAAQADGSRILLGVRPFFPLMVWKECADGVDGKLAVGINLFMGDGCEAGPSVLGAAGGRAFVLADSATGLTTAPGLVGWHYVDEWDERLPGTVPFEQLRAAAPDPPDGRLSFLTLTTSTASPSRCRRGAGSTRPSSRSPT